MIISLALLYLTASHALDIEKADLRIFFTLKQALDFFRNESVYSETPLAEQILHTFQHDCCALQDTSIPDVRKPFIVIEGNHRQSRNVVGMRLARLMRGRYLVHPASCLQNYTNQLPKGTFFRRAFYILSLYALSIDVRFHLSLGRPVVINGYWWDMLTFALVQAFPTEDPWDMPDHMLKFPKDLIQPDLVFFLNFPDNLFVRQATTRSPQSWKPRMLQLYQRLQKRGEPIMFQDLRAIYGPTTDAILETIIGNLSSHRDVWFDSKRNVNFDYTDP